MFAVRLGRKHDLFRCIVLNIRSVVADESATELNSCNKLLNSDRHSSRQFFEDIISQIISIFVISLSSKVTLLLLYLNGY